MTLAERIRSAGMTMPDYGGSELGAVLPAALSAVGAGACVTARDAAADQARLGIPDATHVCVVIVDGLGRMQLDERRGHAPFLRGLGSDQLTAGYPTTTAASLALFGTGQPSGRTGMAGYTVRNPASGELANLISWDGAEPAETWQPMPSLLEQASDAGVEVTTLGKARFAGSGLTYAALRGGQFVGADKLADRIDVALAAAKRPGVSYMYWGEIDAAGHAHGWQSSEWSAALEAADREIGRLARSLPRGAQLVITADHGMIDVDPAHRWDAGAEAALLADVELTAGEPRAVHVHTDKPDEVAARWQDFLGEHAVVATRAEAAQARLFGDLAPEMAARIGDVVVAMRGRATVVDSRFQSDNSMALIGVHGSLTPEETLIPLLQASAS